MWFNNIEEYLHTMTKQNRKYIEQESERKIAKIFTLNNVIISKSYIILIECTPGTK